MVVVVAFLLAFISQALKPVQDTNVALDKKRQILAALNIRDLSNDEVAARYAEVVVADRVIDKSGAVTAEGTRGGEESGFLLNSADYKAGRLAVFVCDVDGQTKYVIPVYGMGLWGAISGYIALDNDRNTIYGTYFNHDSETAGLGAEIKDSKAWQDKFVGKKLFAVTESGLGDIAIAVRKPSDIKNPASEVDAITGATLTSNGVSDMLREGFGEYKAFLNTK